MTADLTWLLLAPGRAIRNRQNKHLPAEWVDVPTHCVLVDTPDGKLLWDTSCPRDWETRWAPTGLHDFFPYEKVSDEEYLDSRLKQIGVAPGDIDYVVLSHLHFDHAGNVQLFKETNARLVCSAKEKEWAFGFDGAFNGAHLKADYQGLDFETVDGDAEFLPGGQLHPDPRPHPGEHVDAGRPARDRHDDLHRGRGLHGRQLRSARGARRDRQQPRAVLLLGGEAARHRDRGERDHGVRARPGPDQGAAHRA